MIDRFLTSTSSLHPTPPQDLRFVLCGTSCNIYCHVLYHCSIEKRPSLDYRQILLPCALQLGPNSLVSVTTLKYTSQAIDQRLFSRAVVLDPASGLRRLTIHFNSGVHPFHIGSLNLNLDRCPSIAALFVAFRPQPTR